MANPFAFIKRHGALLILFMINLINYMDRYILSAVLPYISKDINTDWGMNLGDFQQNVLQSVFIVSYALCGPAFGLLGDRYNRVYLIVGGIAMWCVFTLGGSFANSYPLFTVFRALVGVGEACWATLAPFILSDIYAGGKRMAAFGFFYCATPIGTGAGYLLGELIAGSCGEGTEGCPNWRWAFRVTPISGALFVILLFLTVKEPARGQTEGAGKGLVKKESGIRGVCTDIGKVFRVKTFLFSTLGLTLNTFVLGSLAFSAPTFVIRAMNPNAPNDDNEDGTTTLIVGGLVLGGGFIGSIGATYLSSVIMKKTKMGDTLLCAIGMLVATPSLLGFYYVISYVENNVFIAGYVMAFLAITGLLFSIPLTTSITLYVIPPPQRGLAQGISLVISHLLGDAFSPLLVGALSDYLHENQHVNRFESLQLALMCTVAACGLGSMTYFIASCFVKKDKGVIDELVLREQQEDSEGDTSRLIDENSHIDGVRYKSDSINSERSVFGSL